MTGRAITVFVSPYGNQFMVEIAEWIAEAARLTGRDASVEQHRLPEPGDGVNLVVAPHEFFVLSPADPDDIARAVAVSVPVCTEQPGTPWFNLAANIAADAPYVIDINTHGVDAWRALGRPADRLQLGAVPSMVVDRSPRDLDVLFLGGVTPWRERRLAELAPVLVNCRHELRLSRFTRPIDPSTAGTIFGADKYRLLARTSTLLNIHRDDRPEGYFEWARLIEAMANGCAVITEPVAGFAPLTAGDHFVATRDLAHALERLLDDPDDARDLGERARHAVVDEYPLVASLAPLLDRLDDIDPSCARPLRARVVVTAHPTPLSERYRPNDDLRAEVFDALMAEQRLLREIDEARCLIRTGDADAVERTATTTYESTTPTISILVSVHDYAHLVRETLDTVAAATGPDDEVVIVDDHSRDDSVEVVRAFMRDHDDLAIVHLVRQVNRGLSEARNLAIEHARGDRCMILDADNHLLPHTLRVLSDALDAHPAAAFAYGVLEAFGHEPGLRSELGWSPRWLCEANYIDAQALVRAEVFARHGGYRDPSERTYGWEDWELWLRLADVGEHGVHVPSILGRYRSHADSMLSITNLGGQAARAALIDRYPSLPWPEHDGRPDDPELAELHDELARLNERLGRVREAQDRLQRRWVCVRGSWKARRW